MSYPYGQPGNPGYGTYPSQPPHGLAQQGLVQPGYPPQGTGRGAAITAGVLGLVQGLIVLAISIAGAFATRGDRHDGMPLTGDYIALVAGGIVAVLYLAGSVLLMCKHKIGRVLLIIIPAVLMLVALGFEVRYLIIDPKGAGGSDGSATAVMLSILFALELPVLCLAVTRSAGRWVASRNAGAATSTQYSYNGR
jgi:hypothetical protein